MASNRSHNISLLHLVSLILLFLSSSNSNAAANLYNWTFTFDNQTPPYITGTTQYNNETYVRTTRLTLDSNERAVLISIIKNRLFQTNTGFNTSSVNDLQSKLIEQGWFIDQATRTIYKDSYPNRDCNYFNENKELVDFTYTGNTGVTFPCPTAAVKAAASFDAAQHTPRRSYTFIGWQSEAINYSNNIVTGRFAFVENKTDYEEQITIYRISVHNKLVLPNRSFMSESQLLDFALQDNLVKVSDLFKAFSNYEKLNNAAYLYITARFMPLEPTQTDIELPDNGNGNPTNPTNPNNPNNPTPTNPDGTTIGFCTWASVVCETVVWLKDVSGLSEEDGKITYNDTQGDHYYTGYFAWTPMCPSDISKTTTILGQEWTYNFEFTMVCNFLQMIAPYLKFLTYLYCAFIVAGVRSA